MQRKMSNAKWVLVAILVLGIAGLVMSSEHPKSSRLKIVKGHEVDIVEVPFQLSLVIPIINESKSYMCGATVISASWGMSSLHCFVSPDRPVDKGFWLRNTRVRSGSSQVYNGGYKHKLTDMHWYSTEYYPETTRLKHDIVLFKVTPMFRFSDYIKAAMLPSVESSAPDQLTVSGWGQMNTQFKHRILPKFLRATHVSRVEWQDCVQEDRYYQKTVKKDRNLCYGKGHGSPDSCHGDSGGPLADSETVYGIVSFGLGCGSKSGIYTRVSYYRPWIKKITHL